MGTEEGSHLIIEVSRDTQVCDSNTKGQPNIKTESPFTNSDDDDYNGGIQFLIEIEPSSENVDIKNMRVKSELDCTNNVYANHSSHTNEKFVNRECSSCPTKCQENVTPVRNLKRKACYNLHIKQEVSDAVNRESCEVQNESISVNPNMIKMENGCTNSGCNAHAQCLQTFKCNKCNLVFTEKKMFSMHYKQCTSEIPLVPLVSNTKSLISHHSNHESSKDLKKFIEKIREHPCLYNANNKDYINIQLKNLLWTEIASECRFINGIAAKAAWKKLVNNFCEFLKHPPIQAKHFKYQKQMEFLLPYVNSAIHNERHLNNEVIEPIMVVSDDVDTDDVHIVQQLMSPAKKQRVMQSNINETQASIRGSRETKIRRRPSSQPLDMFFLSMCETTKNLPAHLQISVKRKVFQAVIEAEEVATTMTNDTPNNQTMSNMQNEEYTGIFPFRTNSVTAVVDNSSSSQED